ncbi:DUF3098 domain-containing protein [Chitinophaga nivalis]|uniref:DUF3098 domain-containing protein n=1 Tax=Chitinophaga nivalis TaxID=2991709 RepID=A0ABT3IWT2_9BACT|nr:DUF3098 domain-containing protein [Chitinophaga nivalis]MCW3461889.1 DUF3098 domain-containing protein [Chitinophaga nivalis]MCW3488420.1 DUF3098 domain-containing protein [Chitinophaga nivalis]
MAKETIKTAGTTVNPEVDNKPIFPKENYKFMLAGVIVVALGFLLMMGGSSSDPNSFKPEEVYSFRRITLAPIVIVLGLLVEVYAIMHRPKPKA